MVLPRRKENIVFFLNLDITPCSLTCFYVFHKKTRCCCSAFEITPCNLTCFYLLQTKTLCFCSPSSGLCSGPNRVKTSSTTLQPVFLTPRTRPSIRHRWWPTHLLGVQLPRLREQPSVVGYLPPTGLKACSLHTARANNRLPVEHHGGRSAVLQERHVGERHGLYPSKLRCLGKKTST